VELAGAALEELGDGALVRGDFLDDRFDRVGRALAPSGEHGHVGGAPLLGEPAIAGWTKC
jgi:hypothetical protein